LVDCGFLRREERAEIGDWLRYVIYEEGSLDSYDGCSFDDDLWDILLRYK